MVGRAAEISRRLRLKRMVKRRHKPISDSEISTLAHYKGQQTVGHHTAYLG